MRRGPEQRSVWPVRVPDKLPADVRASIRWARLALSARSLGLGLWGGTGIGSCGAPARRMRPATRRGTCRRSIATHRLRSTRSSPFPEPLSPCGLARVAQQRDLADAGLATNDQYPAAPLPAHRGVGQGSHRRERARPSRRVLAWAIRLDLRVRGPPARRGRAGARGRDREVAGIITPSDLTRWLRRWRTLDSRALDGRADSRNLDRR